MTELVVGPARSAELAELSEIAFRAKAYWGYPTAWLEEWRPQLTLSPGDLDRQSILVARLASRPRGFCSLLPDGPELALEHLWVDPPAMGKGIGRRLLRCAQREASRLGWEALRIDADPNAEAFYLHFGAVRVGMVPAPVAGLPRHLPRLRLPVAATGA